MGAATSFCARGRYLVFQLAERTYAVPVEAVKEIVPMAELAQVAVAPSFLAGFLDLGGELIAVVSLRRLFKLSDNSPGLYTPIIILNAAPQRIALEVDAVQQIADISPEHAVALNDGYALNDFAIAAARLDGKPVLLLSPERLFLEEERRRLAELTELTRDRLAAVEAPTA